MANNAAAARERRLRRQAEGKCAECGSPAAAGFSKCDGCRATATGRQQDGRRALGELRSLRKDNARLRDEVKALTWYKDAYHKLRGVPDGSGIVGEWPRWATLWAEEVRDALPVEQ